MIRNLIRRPHLLLQSVVTLGVLVMSTLVVRATTLAPLTFENQVADSDAIIRARVLSNSSKIVSAPEGQVVMTFTKLETLEAFSGSTASIFELRTLGGTADGLTMKVDGIPKLKPGDEYVLFIKDNGQVVCPIVGWSKGACLIDSQLTSMSALVLPTLLMADAKKTLEAILAELKTSAGPASEEVAKLILSQEKIEALAPKAPTNSPAIVTLDQFRQLIKFHSKAD